MKKIEKNSTVVFYSIFVFTLLVASCSNKKDIETGRLRESGEVNIANSKKKLLQDSTESLKNQIDSLTNRKKVIEQFSAIDSSIVFKKVQNSFLDHFIIGTKNLHEISQLFIKLGFTVKEGRKHNNGIRNNFIEFGDKSEFEIIEVSNPTDKISKEYKSLIENHTSGLQFALRINEIEKLKNSFEKLDYPFTELDANNFYSTLSSDQVNTELPIFFIQFNNENNNSVIDHPNKTKGIKSIWFETKDIKKSAKQLVDLGFSPIGNYEIPPFKNKVVEFRNNNFGIILIESDKYQISGITILVEDFSDLKNILNKNKFAFDERSNKNIFLKPLQTNSIWIEFLSN